MRIQIVFAVDNDAPDSVRTQLEDFVKGAIEKAFQTHGGEIFYGSFVATPGTPPAQIHWGPQDSYFGKRRKRDS